MTDEPPSGLAEALRDRYVLERELGRGGMATVYAAHDVKHGRRVALKVLHPELAASLGPERFEREIRLAAQLQHPHILPVHDSGEAAGRLYYVMPLVEGESLRQRLAREHELPVGETVRILEEVVEALAYAHERGVVHRDVKPDNIMLSGRHALLTDLGVAKAVSAAESGESLTSTGIALGTPRYMAPEQVAADPHADHRVDLYAVGVMGYEMLTGAQPFQGGTPQAVFAAQISHQPTPLHTLRSGVTVSLSQAIMRCLASRPADRWQSAADLLGVLEREHDSGGFGGQADGRTGGRYRRKWMIWLVAGAVATAIPAAVIFARRGVSREITVGSRSPLTLEPGLEIDPAVSPDGKLVAYAGGWLNASRIYVRQVEGGRPILIAPDVSGAQRMPFWSPDGRRILYRSVRGVEIVPALGGVSKVVVPRGTGALLPGPWSPDGRRIAFARSDSLFAMPTEGGAAELLAHGGDMHSFAWSPDGRWIAAVLGDRQSVDPDVRWFFGNLGQSAIWAIPALPGDGAAIRITDDRSFHASPVWLPDGGGLIYLSNADGGLDVYRVALDRSAKPTGRAVRLTTGLNAHAMSMDAAGRRLAYTPFEERSNIWSLPIPARPPASPSAATAVTTGTQVVESFDISPDGQWLLFDSDRSGFAQIYRVPLAGGDPEQLTTDSAAHFWPRYSPDGKSISFHSFRNGGRRLFVMAADGSDPRPIPLEPGDDRTAEWRRDGGGVYYLHAFDSPGVELRFVPRDAAGRWGKATTFKRVDALPVALSPDGKRLAVATDKGLMVMTPSGDSERVLLPVSYRARELKPTYVSWSTDSRTLYYLAVDTLDKASVWGIDPVTAARTLLVRFDDPDREWHRYGFLATRGKFYVTIGDQQSDIWTASVGERRP